MVKGYYLFFAGIIIILISCYRTNYRSIDNWNSIFKSAYNNYHNKSDSIYKIDKEAGMSMYICDYINSYYERPKDISSLIRAFDKTEYANEMRAVYDLQYRLMTKYESNLKLFLGDSITALFYKRISPLNVIQVTSIVKPEYQEEGNLLDIRYSYFDKDGYLLSNQDTTDTLRKNYFTIVNRYHMLYHRDTHRKDVFKASNSGLFLKNIFIEYNSTLKTATNIETKKSIPNHPFFKEIEDWMKATCKKYGFSRMVIPSWIPKDVTF